MSNVKSHPNPQKTNKQTNQKKNKKQKQKQKTKNKQKKKKKPTKKKKKKKKKQAAMLFCRECYILSKLAGIKNPRLNSKLCHEASFTHPHVQ